MTPSGFEFDLFSPPRVTAVGAARVRDRVAVAGVVTAVTSRDWVGTRALEVTLTDGTGSLVLAFFGRRSIPGVAIGRSLVAGGTVAHHRGRLLLLNPYLWLCDTDLLPTATTAAARVLIDA